MWNEEIERAMLYYLIIEGEDYVLNEDDFVEYENKKIIKAINELKAQKKQVSILAIQEQANEVGNKDFLEYITDLGSYIRKISPDEVYNRLIELSKKRKLYKLLQEKTDEIESHESIDTLIQKTIREMNGIQQINEKETSFLEQVVNTVTEMEEEQKKGIDYSMYTGIQGLDDKTFGLHDTEFTVIGARPRNW